MGGHWKASAARLVMLSVGYGAIAGVLALLTLQLMTGLQHAIWGDSSADQPLRIALTIIAGGALIVVLSFVSPTESVAELLRGSGSGHQIHRRLVSTALVAIVAVAFGGAIGPEAGLLAVIAELSALVVHRLASDVRAQVVLREAGSAGVLGGLYGSPPGAAAVEDDTLGPGKLLKISAAIGGFAAFVITSRLVFDGGGLSPIELPSPQPGSIGAELLVVIPALLGALIGLLFVRGHHALEAIANRIPRPWLVIAIGSVLFAALAAALPIVRFSGHHEIAELIEFADEDHGGVLAAIALAKILALTLCLVARWRGGEVFPLLFAGAAVGASMSAVIPALDLASAMAAGMAATAAVGWRRPLAVLLVLVLMVNVSVALPLIIGIGIGYAVNALNPEDAEPATKQNPSGAGS